MSVHSSVRKPVLISTATETREILIFTHKIDWTDRCLIVDRPYFAGLGRSDVHPSRKVGSLAAFSVTFRGEGESQASNEQ